MRERSLWIFIGCSALLLAPLLVGVLTHDHLTWHEAVNRHHTPWADRLFAVGTNLADGLVPTFVALALLWRSWRAFLMMGWSTGISALLVQALKHGPFADVDRPAMFMERMPGAQFVAGVELNHHFSFPSGHATAAFSMCLAAAVLLARRDLAAGLAVLAVFLGFSRIYLSQHFTEDVLAGAVLGILTAVSAYVLFYRGPWSRRAALDRSPFRRQR